jgi:hypothetical protein
MKRSALAAALLVTTASPLAAQDSHYWLETYGTYATLLGGVVVGKVPDLSASFYNPGRLAFAQRPAIALNTRVYQIQSLHIDLSNTKYASAGDLGATGVRPSPSFAGGVLPVGDRQKFVTAYTFLSRQSDDVRLDGTTFDSSGASPTGAEVFLQRQASDSWYGLSLGYRLGPRTGIGVTVFGAYRSQYQRGELTAQSDSTPPQAVTTTKQYSYYDLGLVVKAGISTELGPWGLGAAVTAPRLHVLGSGSAYYAQVATPGGVQYAWRADSAPDVNYKSSWAIAGGITRTFGKTTLYASAEWFAPVSRYSLLDADSVVPTDGRAAFDDDLIFERQAVVAWGLGFEYRVKTNRALYAHFTVDPSSRPKNTGVNTTYDRWGTYHAGGGYAFRLGQWDLVTGLVYNWGSDTYTAGQGEPPPGGATIPAGTSATVSNRRLRVLFGFNVRF